MFVHVYRQIIFMQSEHDCRNAIAENVLKDARNVIAFYLLAGFNTNHNVHRFIE